MMRMLTVGDSALLVEFADSAEVDRWFAELRTRADAGAFRAADIVPAARTILLDGLTDVGTVRNLLARLSDEIPAGGGPHAAACETESTGVEVPVRYDGADLPEIATAWQMSEDEVVATHLATTFRVAFCGFSPGFAYLTGLSERLRTPRRATPRTAVPAGSVALAGEFTGIYPSASPGGWQLLGRTALTLFDVRRDPPALLTPGTTVRFTAL